MMLESTTEVAVAATRPTVPARLERSRFYFAMSIVMLVLVFVGFGPTLFLRPLFDVRPIPSYLYVHGAILTGWYSWFIVQTSLIASNRRTAHRRLGIIGVALGAAAAAISALTALRLAPRFSSFRDVESNLHFFAEILWVNVALLICFSVFLSAAIAYRNRPALHKRLILLASLSFMPPAVTRIIDWPIWGFGNNAYFPLLCCLVGMIAALGLHDFAQRRAVHPVTLIGGSALAVLFAIGAFLMPATEIGRSVVYELYLLMR